VSPVHLMILTSRDILRLTALFEARRGRSFLAALSQREGRNYQFDFLRPQHSLYGYYNRTVAQYVKIFNPLPDQMERLHEDKWATLEHARERSAFEKQRRNKQDAKQKEQDEEASECLPCALQLELIQ
jgi:splicing factor 3A subunit 1